MILFPKGFYWGAATASFQIEGATKENGRGESIWDRFAATPGKIRTGERGDPACDSYHRYREDVELLRAMHLNAYRFSTAWCRVVPDGSGPVNPAGLDYYDHVVDALLEADITPFITLYHWDLPQPLQDSGGWANRATVDAYVRYVDIVVSRLGDRVKHWMTHNEPLCVALLGNETGEHAPGLRDRAVALQVGHNVLISHGLAMPVIRRRCSDAEVGIVLNLSAAYPETDSEADQVATNLFHARMNRWFIDPIMGKGYPRDAVQYYGSDMPSILDGDMDIIASAPDFLGVNYYAREVCHDPTTTGSHRTLHRRDPNKLTDRGWEIYPQGLLDLLTWLKRDYALSDIFITENGASYPDVVAADGGVHDALRQQYLAQHLKIVLQAIDAGVPVRGYFCWTLTDNFEWQCGSSSRFGLAYTDFATQQRTIKDSGHWFGSVARNNALPD